MGSGQLSWFSHAFPILHRGLLTVTQQEAEKAIFDPEVPRQPANCFLQRVELLVIDYQGAALNSLRVL
jgi:hypothetical protein